MKFLVLGDVHAELRRINQWIERFPEVDAVLQCGDLGVWSEEDFANWGYLVDKAGHYDISGSKAPFSDIVSGKLKLNKPLIFICFTENNYISTNTGMRKIKDVLIGQKVLTGKGNYERVVDFHKRKVKNQELRRIKLRTSLFPIECTANHKIMCLQGEKVAYKEARAIQVGNYVEVSFTRRIKDIQTIKISDYCTISYQVKEKHIYLDWNSKNKIRLLDKVVIDADFCYFLGLSLAEGTFPSPYEFFLYFNAHEKEQVTFCKKYLTKLGLNPRIFLRKNCWWIGINSKIFANFMQNLVGKGARAKVLHKDMMLLPPGKQKYIIKGLIDGDGSLEKRRRYMCFSTRSLNLIENFRNLCWRCKINPALNKYKDDYCGRIMERDFIKEIWGIKRKHTRKYTSFVVLKDRCFLRVNKVEKFTFSGFVYNLTVQREHSYTCSGIHVANCGNHENFDYRDSINWLKCSRKGATWLGDCNGELDYGKIVIAGLNGCYSYKVYTDGYQKRKKIKVKPETPPHIEEYLNRVMGRDPRGRFTKKDIDALKKVKADILLLHEPPMEMFDSGELAITQKPGSSPINELIEKMQPKIALIGHMHERKSYSIGETVIEALPTADRGCAILDTGDWSFTTHYMNQ